MLFGKYSVASLFGLSVSLQQVVKKSINAEKSTDMVIDCFM